MLLLTDDDKLSLRRLLDRADSLSVFLEGGVDAGESLWEAGSRDTGGRCKDQNSKTREIFLSAKYVWEKSLPIRPIERRDTLNSR
jgi:hypothetical protein